MINEIVPKKKIKNAEKILILISNDIDIGIRIIKIVYRSFIHIVSTTYRLCSCMKFQNNKIRRFA